MIVDNRNITDMRITNSGRLCSTMVTPSLHEILTTFGIQFSDTNTRDDLCMLIYQRLQDIGHML